MSVDFDKILKLSKDDRIELGTSFKELLHKKLVLGQTRYVCRYGTLSDGHEKVTPALRYFQAIREMYYLSNNMADYQARAMEHQADLIEAQQTLEAEVLHPANKLRAEARVLRAQVGLKTTLVTIEDQLRMVDEYNKVRLELEPLVEEQYPEGIEQAELDNWTAVFEYRMHRQQATGSLEHIANIPLPPERKAELGYKYHRMDAIAPLALESLDKIQQLEHRLQSKEIA